MNTARRRGGPINKVLLGMVLGIFLASVPRAFTQRPPERINVGEVNLQLGMAKDAVISRLTEQGYESGKVVKVSNDAHESWFVSQKNKETGEYDSLGSLAFDSGRLSWVSAVRAESWDAGSSKIGKNLYFLMKSFEDSGNTSCSVETKFQEGPEFDSRETLLHCGKRVFSIAVSRIREQHEETQLTEAVRNNP
jgi:hypothetical protein